MGVIVRKSNPTFFLEFLRHPESGTPCPPGSWELDHSIADIDLVRKAWYRNSQLSDSERERLMSLVPPPIGKALANPSSLTEGERRFAMGWPSPEQIKANIAAVGLGDMSPEEILTRTSVDSNWLKTMDQADLVINRFNIRPSLRSADQWVFTLDQDAADSLARTPQEHTAYVNAFREKKLFKRPPSFWEGAQERVVEIANQIEAKRAYERKKEKGQFCLISTPEWIRQLGREGGSFGFIIYKTADVRVAIDEFLRHCSYTDIKYEKCWRAFLEVRIFGPKGEMGYFHFLTRATWDSFHDRDYIKWSTGDLETAADNVSAYKADYRLARIQEPQLHQRYFLIIDKEGLPPVKNIIITDKPVFPEVWVYDSDWEPPTDGDGIRDKDGYQGRLRVRTLGNPGLK